MIGLRNNPTELKIVLWMWQLRQETSNTCIYFQLVSLKVFFCSIRISLRVDKVVAMVLQCSPSHFWGVCQFMWDLVCARVRAFVIVFILDGPKISISSSLLVLRKLRELCTHSVVGHTLLFLVTPLSFAGPTSFLMSCLRSHCSW